LSLFEQSASTDNNKADLSHVGQPAATDAKGHRWPPEHRYSPDKSYPEARLWLCVRLPYLAIEAVDSQSEPTLVSAEDGGRAVVYACNPKAIDAGIYPGMALTAALALLPTVSVCVRDSAAEERLLERLAQLLTRYTPVVCTSNDGMGGGVLFLEIAASLRLFGGVENIERCVLQDLHSEQLRVFTSVAPFARAALWLAHAGRSLHCYARVELRSMLGSLPVSVTGWPESIQKRLRHMGVQTLNECLRLPRDGFARRIGRQCLLELDEALGGQPEVYQPWKAPVSFQDVVDLGGEVRSLTQISQVAEQMLQRLRQFLLKRQLYADSLQLKLLHFDRPPGLIDLSLREPVCSVEHLQELLQLKLERLQLQAPVTALTLTAATAAMRPDISVGLLPGSAESDDARLVQLLDRLRARLGGASVYGMSLEADHRPELAWSAVDVTAGRAAHSLLGTMVGRKRPLWLLRRPVQLRVRQGRPEYRGCLSFGADCERIETGWWDDLSVRRKYYVVTGAEGHRWWVYRERHSWYLHGAFG